MKNFKPTPLALVLGALFAAPAALAQPAAAPTDVGRISVEGKPGGTDTGLLTQEDTPKARSSVNRGYLDQLNPSTNPYQAIDLLPGVNTFSYDATGLFGGGLRVRGFAADQMGFTINGAPVNDSGNFAVFPQEYTDSENLCEIFLTQGSTDTEAPHVGASGGNVGLVSCGPQDTARLRVAQSFGQLRYSRTFIRADTGKLLDNTFRGFISYSKSTADKFKGPGKADRDHVDLGADYRPNAALSFSTSLLYNRAINNNYRTLTLAQIAQFGRGLDFGTAVPQHLTPVRGTAQVETNPPDGYYKFNINPFENYLWTGKVEYKASDAVRLSAEPYFWYGFGTGGNQLATLREGNSATLLGRGVRDINGDGDTLDTIQVYRSSVTRTYRPGITLKLNARLDNHQLLAGLWYERARHRQTAPATPFDNNGTVGDLWLDTPSQYILRQDGSAYQNRDWLTISTGTSVFVQDSISLLQDKLNLQLGVRQSQIERDFTNYANEGSTSATGASTGNYEITKRYRKTLPSIGVRYSLTPEQSVFFNAAQNFRAPSNFTLSNLLVGGRIVGGVLTGATLRQPGVEAETSNNFDLGYRYAGERFTASGSLFYVSFKNRIARAYDPNNNVVTDYNVGDSTLKGVEFETGYKLDGNWSLYGSLSYTDSEIKSNLQLALPPAAAEQTAGKQFPDTPKWLAALGVNFSSGGWFGSMQVKYTGKAFSTLVNDEAMPAYTLVNAAAGYRFVSSGFFKNPEIRLNVVNLFDRDYLRINSPSGSNFTVRAQGPGGQAPSYYIGAPRFVSVTLRSDF
jgi:iron complex outermembrane receptor protein